MLDFTLNPYYNCNNTCNLQQCNFLHVACNLQQNAVVIGVLQILMARTQY